METSKESGKSSASDENADVNRPDRDEGLNQSLLVDDIKKIIDDLDVKFVESADDDDPLSTTTTGSLLPALPQNSRKQRTRSNTGTVRGKKHKNRSSRQESLSTLSEATTVVNQLPPAPIKAHLLQSEKINWPQYCGGISSPRFQNDHMAYMNQVVGEQAIYYPERDEVTEPTTSETIQSSMERTDQSSSLRQPPTPSEALWSPRINTQPSWSPERQVPQVETNTHENAQQNFTQQQHSHQNANPQPDVSSIAHNTIQMPPPGYNAYNDNRTAGVGHYYYENVNPRLETSNHQQHCNHQQTEYPQYQPQQDPPQMRESVDRYNSTHRMFSTVKEPERKRKRSALTDFLFRKKRSDDTDRSEIVPQLYKASIKPGTVPNRFTFRAVTESKQYSSVPSRPAPKYRETEPVHVAMPVMVDYQEQLTAPSKNGPPCRQCCCSMENQRRNPDENGCTKATKITDDGIKTKAYYTDMGCGYISQNSVPEKVDVYCFDQLNTGFFRTSDHPPPLYADIAIQRTEKYATVFWAEIFGLVNVVTAFVIAMILQTFKFVLQGILRPIMIGFVQLLSDYLIKPFLTLLYNGFTQPISIFLYNVLSSIRDVLQPLAKGIGYFFELFAVILRAIRLVEVKNITNITPCGSQQMKC